MASMLVQGGFAVLSLYPVQNQNKSTRSSHCCVMNGGVFLGNFVKSLMESYDLPIAAIATGLFPATIFFCLRR
eukprot:gene31858-41341_t